MTSYDLELGDIRGNAAVIPNGSILVVRNGKIIALSPGTNGQQLQADSAHADGVKWAAAS